MARPLLWLLGGLLLFLAAVAMLAPGLVGGRALALGLAPALPALLVALVVWDVRRRRGDDRDEQPPTDPEG